jgi:hypothetical protein
MDEQTRAQEAGIAQGLADRLRYGANWGVIPTSDLGDFGIFDEAAAALAEKDAEITRLREVIDRDAARLDDCSMMIANGFNASGTLRAEQTIKAKHYALEARNSLSTTRRAASHNARSSHASAVEVGAANGDTK